MSSHDPRPAVDPVTVEIEVGGPPPLVATRLTRPHHRARGWRRAAAGVVALGAVAAAGVSVATGIGGSTPGRRSGLPRTAAAPRAEPTTVERLAPPLSHPAPGAHGREKPIAGGAYVSRDTELTVDRTGHTITRLIVESRCAPAAPLPPIPIARDGAFRLETALPGPPATAVTVIGRFLSSTRVALQAQFVAPGCNAGTIVRILRLL